MKVDKKFYNQLEATQLEFEKDISNYLAEYEKHTKILQEKESNLLQHADLFSGVFVQEFFEFQQKNKADGKIFNLGYYKEFSKVLNHQVNNLRHTKIKLKPKQISNSFNFSDLKEMFADTEKVYFTRQCKS